MEHEVSLLCSQETNQFRRPV